MRERHIHAALGCIKRGNIGWLAKQACKFFAVPLSQGFKKALCGPIEGIITPTYRCNSACIMCDIPRRGRKPEELSLNEWYKVVDDMVDLGISGMGISGGEPLLSEHTIPLVKYITRKKIPVHISSNGFLLNDKKVEQLIDAGLGSIAISIDSTNPETNDMLRGNKGGFEKAVTGIRTIANVRSRIKNCDLRLTVASAVSRQNIHNILGIVDLAEDLGADTVSFLPVMTSGIIEDKKNRAEILTLKKKDQSDVDLFIRKLIELKKKRSVIDNSIGFLKAMKCCFANKPFPATCFAGYTICVVGADGNVFPCFDFLGRNRFVGNVKQRSLKNIWLSEEYAEMRTITAKCRDCYLTCHQEFNLLYKFTGNLLSG